MVASLLCISAIEKKNVDFVHRMLIITVSLARAARTYQSMVLSSYL